MIRRLPWVLASWALYAGPAQAQSFECSPATGSSFTQVWNESNRCIPVAIGRAGALVREQSNVVESAFRRWEGSGCSDVSFDFRGETGSAVGFDPGRDDNENIVLSVDDAEMLAMFGDRDLLAVTLTSFSTATGEIFDGDIVVNDGVFDFARVDDVESCARRPSDVFDLENTLAHEVGHLLGFAHNADQSSTLFGSSPPCEIQKRSLEALDIDGLCSVYPSDGPSRACRPPSSYEFGDTSAFRNQCEGGCSCRGHGDESIPSVALVLILGGAWLVRRRFSGR